MLDYTVLIGQNQVETDYAPARVYRTMAPLVRFFTRFPSSKCSQSR